MITKEEITKDEKLERQREQQRAWRAKNPEKDRQHVRAYRKKYPERVRASHQRYRDKNREMVRAKSRAWRQKNLAHCVAYGKKRYAEKRDIILARAHKLRDMPEALRPRPEFCECCGGPPGVRSLHLDHCHETNKFRGWLCYKCNAAIGGLGDTITGVRKALEYLERSKGIV